MPQSYPAAFLRAVAFILPHEEDFLRGHWGDENFVVAENESGDSGGLTKFGIDQASHPGVDIAALNRDQAVTIYFEEWKARDLDLLPDKLAIACFDVFVNGGHAIMWLQRAMNAVGFVTTPLRDLPIQVDGVLGPRTIARALTCDQDAVVLYFIHERNARFQAIALGPRAKFLDGWEQRDADLEKFLLAA